MCCNRRELGCRKGGCLRGGELELAMPAWWRNNYVDLALDRKDGGMLTKSIVRLIPEPGAKQFRTKQTAALLEGGCFFLFFLQKLSTFGVFVFVKALIPRPFFSSRNLIFSLRSFFFGVQQRTKKIYA